MAAIDSGPVYERILQDFAPDVIVHTCHSRESVALRKKVGALHLTSIFFRGQPLDEWSESFEGLAPNELAFQVTGQEPRGQIEPLVGAGTRSGGGTAEAFTPIDERIHRIAARAKSWIRLRQLPESEKRVAFVYWDREMGKAELMRGSATGMFMNGPRSLLRVLRSMQDAGYHVDPLPEDERELVQWMQERGRQIGLWAPETLDALAQSGEAVMIPAARYRSWFDQKLTTKQRALMQQHWGPPPGKHLVWERDGKRFVVIPRIRLGNVVLLPQPLRGEAHDKSKLHDKLVPPPHNYLATYFWLQEQFQADALVHFGTHGSEFLLPGKPTGLSREDWPDLLVGTKPNINPWIINNLGESLPVRRRPYAVLVNHLVPPSVAAELSDDLYRLHTQIHKWRTLEAGALRERFGQEIAKLIRSEHLDEELDLELPTRPGPDGVGAVTVDAEHVDRVVEYLHEIHNETTPISLHEMGVVPPDELLGPWIVTCLGSKFREELGRIAAIPGSVASDPGEREAWLRELAEAWARRLLREGERPGLALRATLPEGSGEIANAALTEHFEQAAQLIAGFRRTPEEIGSLLRALDGAFVEPGPGNSPERNPAVLPTGRNMYLLNPQEVPARASWQIGVQLVEQLLAGHVAKHGKHPRRVAFTLNSMATFQDYGVMESQILFLLGVRPVWDARGLVTELELIPASELKRPRVDVFLSVLGYYRDMLPSRMKLLDAAVRLVADLDEEGNQVHAHCMEAERRLRQSGVPRRMATAMARGRIFGRGPGENGSAGYYYLLERSADWDTREDLVKAYLEHSRYIYTGDTWGVFAPAAYEAHVQETDVLLRSWSDRTRSPLSNKYDWYKAGSLSLAIEHLTGRRPEWFFSDVRDPARARMVVAEEALAREFRVRLFNRKWITGMMKEGYAGADQIAVHVSNASGWAVMRSGSVPDSTWNEIFDVYFRDEKQMGLPEWFDRENAFAHQEIAEILLESARKGDWNADPQRLSELASAYVSSVEKHGEGGGMRGARNVAMREFVAEHLARDPGTGGSPPEVEAAEATAVVQGEVLEKRSETEVESPAAAENEPDREEAPSPSDRAWWLALAAGAVLLLGFVFLRPDGRR